MVKFEEYFSYQQIEEKTENFLNEVNEVVTVCGYPYEAGTLLRAVDPIAFAEEINSFLQNYTEVEHNGEIRYVRRGDFL